MATRSLPLRLAVHRKPYRPDVFIADPTVMWFHRPSGYVQRRKGPGRPRARVVARSHEQLPDADDGGQHRVSQIRCSVPARRPTALACPPTTSRQPRKRHVDYMDARNIDVQIIGPRPFRVMGFMEEHLTPNWARFVNDCIQDSVPGFPGPVHRRGPTAAAQRRAGYDPRARRARALREGPRLHRHVRQPRSGRPAHHARHARAVLAPALREVPGVGHADHRPRHQRPRPPLPRRAAQLSARLLHRAVPGHPVPRPRRRLRALPRVEDRGLPLRRWARSLPQDGPAPAAEGPVARICSSIPAPTRASSSKPPSSSAAWTASSSAPKRPAPAATSSPKPAAAATTWCPSSTPSLS